LAEAKSIARFQRNFLWKKTSRQITKDWSTRNFNNFFNVIRKIKKWEPDKN
jgi:hypothetical protein